MNKDRDLTMISAVVLSTAMINRLLQGLRWALGVLADGSKPAAFRGADVADVTEWKPCPARLAALKLLRLSALLLNSAETHPTGKMET